MKTTLESSIMMMIVDRGYPFWFGGLHEWGQVHLRDTVTLSRRGAHSLDALYCRARKILGSYLNHYE